MPTNRETTWIEMDEVANEAMYDCGVDQAGHINGFRIWVVDAVRKIRDIHLTKKYDKDVPIKDLKFKKPCDLVLMIEIRLHGATDGSEDYYGLYNSNDQEKARLGQTDDGIITVDDQGEYWHISSNGSQYSLATTEYRGLPMTDDGKPRIRDYQGVAAKAYCMWRWMVRERNRGNKNITLGDTRDAEMYWRRVFSDAIAKAKQPDMLEFEAAIAKMTTLLPNYSKNIKNKSYKL